MRPELPEPAASLGGDALTAALLDALRFRAYPEVPGDAARRCARRGIRLVVVSNWDVSLHERLAETGLAPLLDGAVASAELGAAKPDPAIFAPRARARGRGARGAWHAGDSPEADVAGALAAGMTPVLVARDGAPAPPGVVRIAALDGLQSPCCRDERPAPSPAPSRCCAPSCRTGSRPSASRRSRAADRARRAARVAAVGAVRGDAGDGRDRDPRRHAGDGRRAARGLDVDAGDPPPGVTITGTFIQDAR